VGSNPTGRILEWKNEIHVDTVLAGWNAIPALPLSCISFQRI